MPHIVFIDAIQSQDKLLTFLQNMFQYAPNTIVIIEIYSKKEKGAEKVKNFILKNIDAHPKKIQNALFLTWQDYIDETIIF
jgi:hypothetical protein